MKLRRALLSFALLTVVYLLALVWVDSRKQVFSQIGPLASILPALAGLSLLSYLLRYARWHWLLARAGHPTRIGRGLLAYLAGFAFTATQGKVGELVRMRYLAPQGVPPSRVLSAFVYERSFDLVTVLLLASLAISRHDVFAVALAFVAIFLGLVVGLAWHPGPLSCLSAHLRRHQLSRSSRWVRLLRDGLTGCRQWLTLRDVSVALVTGLAAWVVTAGAFVLLLQHLGVVMPPRAAWATYPLAMLAGAASMVPGGIGSTELTLVALLSFFNVSVATATLAAVGIRLASLWFSVLCGLVCVTALEVTAGARRAPGELSPAQAAVRGGQANEKSSRSSVKLGE